jgi:hypothetical protein
MQAVASRSESLSHGITTPTGFEREKIMAESINNRGGNILCLTTTYVIVIIGILAFLYVGQQIGHLDGRMDATIQSPKTAPIAAASFEPLR